MAQYQQSFDPQLMEKLIPWINKPVGEHALTALASEMDVSSRAKLKMELLARWKTESTPIDHRSLCRQCVAVEFASLTHYIASGAVVEFNRLKKLYDEQYTCGLKQAIDAFAIARYSEKKQSHDSFYRVDGWRLSPFKVSDFRRRSGERLMLVSEVVASVGGKLFKAKTANISNGGALLRFEAGQMPPLKLQQPLSLNYLQLCKQYGVNCKPVKYQVVNISKEKSVTQVALKRIDKDSKAEFDQLIAHLMNEHKRRNRLDVDNTVTALEARYYNMAAIAQMESLMVLSHHKERYHLLVSQGQSLNLQAELLIDADMIPFLAENTQIGQSKLYFSWASSRNEVHVAELQRLLQDGLYEAVLNAWQAAVWSKAFLIKADSLDPQLADLGTSLPCDVAPIVSKLNAPLPVKVARLSQELAKIVLIEDISFVIDPIVAQHHSDGNSEKSLDHYRLPPSKGQLRQVPFDKRTLPAFEGTYRFSHDCRLRYGDDEFVIVNGYSDTTTAVVSLSLTQHRLDIGEKVVIVWIIDGSEISLIATIEAYDQLHQSTTLKWFGEPGLVKSVFKELEILCVFNPVFTADLQSNKLEAALRNLVLSNLPKVSIFVNVNEQGISLNGLTGEGYLDRHFIDDSGRAKVDLLFSRQLLQKLAMTSGRQQHMLMVHIAEQADDKKDDSSEVLLLSDFASPQQLAERYRQLSSSGSLFVFALEATEQCAVPEDAIVTIERKYVSHYSPAKARKLENALQYSLCLQLVDMTAIFARLMGR